MSLLVIGANGFIGRQFVKESKSNEIYTVRRLGADHQVCFDPSSDHLRSIPGITQMTHALLLFGEREPDRCTQDPVGTRFVNVDLPCKMVDECKELGITPIFASSELVFDGRIGMYDEASVPQPILEYGRQKIATEQYLLSTTDNGVVLRFPKTYGLCRGDRSLFTVWIDQIRECPKELSCADDQYFSLQLVNEVPKVVRRIILSGVRGVVHLGDGRRHSRFELLAKLCSALHTNGIRVPELKRVSIHDFDLPEKRPTDVSMENIKLVELTGMSSQSVEEVIVRLVREYIQSE